MTYQQRLPETSKASLSPDSTKKRQSYNYLHPPQISRRDTNNDGCFSNVSPFKDGYFGVFILNFEGIVAFGDSRWVFFTRRPGSIQGFPSPYHPGDDFGKMHPSMRGLIFISSPRMGSRDPLFSKATEINDSTFCFHKARERRKGIQIQTGTNCKIWGMSQGDPQKLIQIFGHRNFTETIFRIKLHFSMVETGRNHVARATGWRQQRRHQTPMVAFWAEEKKHLTHGPNKSCLQSPWPHPSFFVKEAFCLYKFHHLLSRK